MTHSVRSFSPATAMTRSYLVLSYFCSLAFLIPLVPQSRAGPLLIAHRGASANFPENTMGAFTSAASISDFVETDAWPTKDGVLVIIHDETVDRTTNGTGKVADLTLSQIKELRANRGFGDRFADERIPTAAEFLRAMYNVAPVILERKAGTVEQYVSLIRNNPWRPENVITSFDYSFLRALKSAVPEVQVMLVGVGTLSIGTVRRGIADGMTSFGWEHTSINEALVQSVQAEGCMLFAWTVNDLTRVRQLVNMGVDGVYTDRAVEFTRDASFQSPEINPNGGIVEIAAQVGTDVMMHWPGGGRMARDVEWRDAAAGTLLGRGASFRYFAADGQHRLIAAPANTPPQDWRAFTIRGSQASADAINLSVRMTVGLGDQQGIIGFSISEDQDLMIRAIGPSLAQFGIAESLAVPLLSVYSAERVLVRVAESWSSNFGMETEFRQRGAFMLAKDTADLAYRSGFSRGAYTAVVGGSQPATSGQALLEIYAPRDGTKPKLTNLSARGLVAPDQPMVAGFIIGGESSRAVLIRAAGPALSRLGLNGGLPDPFLKLYDEAGRLVASNDDWSSRGGTAAIQDAQALAGAFPFRLNSRDAILLISLPRGAYTAHVGPADGRRSGLALLEIYSLGD